jgi:uncharacterized protein YecT (DUF1311 family)
MRAAAVILAVVALAPAVFAQSGGPGADDTKDIEDCIKVAAGPAPDMPAAAKCIGIVSAPCLKRAQSTADMNRCHDREKAVWDDILNETYRRLGAKLDTAQRGKLRDMQRAWIASRDKTCAFYWDYYRGTMASPMASACVNRETAQRALFLLGFLYEQEK